jgi:hypothetical protein
VWIETHLAFAAIEHVGPLKLGAGAASLQRFWVPGESDASRIVADIPSLKGPVYVLGSTTWNDHIQAAICAWRLSCDHTC